MHVLMPATSRLGEQDGTVIVTFVLSIVVILLVASFAVDASNFMRHKRQLQTQADAAALAAGSALRAGCANADVFSRATTFSGTAASTYNRPKATATGTGTLSQSWATTPDPCASGEFEVRVTETGAKWFFPITAVIGVARGDLDISAQARVALKQIAAQKGELPIAMEQERRIRSVWTWLVDEESTPPKPVAGSVRLMAKDTTLTGTQTTRYTTSLPIVHDFHSSSIGVRVAVNTGSADPCASLTESCLESACAAASAVVSCYDGGAAKTGLLHVHAFEQVAPVDSESPPALEDVQITPNSPCVDTAYFSASGCRYHVRAAIDFVALVESDADNRATVTGTLGSAAVTLRPTGGGYWEGDTATALASSGDLKLVWTMKHGKVSSSVACGTRTNNGGQPSNAAGDKATPVCKGVWLRNKALGAIDAAQNTAQPVHRVFVRSTTGSGPISFATVTEGRALANSIRPRCTTAASACPHALSVDLDLPSELQVGSKRVLLKTSSGSNDGYIECDPNNEDPGNTNPSGAPRIEYQIVHGCNGPQFKLNDGSPCPTGYPVGAAHDCITSRTNNVDLQAAMDKRVYGLANPSPAQCAAGRNAYPNFPPDDKRIVSVLIVPAGSLSSSGSGAPFAIKRFAYFYVTGWGEKNNSVTCARTDSKNEDAETGTLVGHFINHVRQNDGSLYGTVDCNTGQIDGCIPVMTK